MSSLKEEEYELVDELVLNVFNIDDLGDNETPIDDDITLEEVGLLDFQPRGTSFVQYDSDPDLFDNVEDQAEAGSDTVFLA